MPGRDALSGHNPQSPSTTPPEATAPQSLARRTAHRCRSASPAAGRIRETPPRTPLHVLAVGLGYALTAQQVAAVRGRNRQQRIHALAITGLKPTFEIGAPYPDWAHQPTQTSRYRRARDASLRGITKPSRASNAPTVLAGRASLRRFPLQDSFQFARPRSACALVATPAPASSILRRLIRVTLACPVSVLQRLQPSLLVPPQPIVTGLPARCCRPHTARSSCVHLAFLFQNKSRSFHPSHCSLSRASRSSTRPVNLQCQESPRSILSGMSPVRTP